MAGHFKRIVLCFALLLSACTSTSVVRLTHNIPAQKSNYKKVAVFLGAPTRKARPLGLIAVARDGENATWAVEVLRMEASELGADAISNLEIHYTSGFFPNLRVQGLAVKYE